MCQLWNKLCIPIVIDKGYAKPISGNTQENSNISNLLPILQGYNQFHLTKLQPLATKHNTKKHTNVLEMDADAVMNLAQVVDIMSSGLTDLQLNGSVDANLSHPELGLHLPNS